MNINIFRDGQQYGPYSLEEIRAHLASGALQAETDLAWREGLTEWQPLHQLLAQLEAEPAPSAAVSEPVAESSTPIREDQSAAEIENEGEEFDDEEPIVEQPPPEAPAPSGYRWTSEKIKPGRTPFSYQIGLFFVSLAMIVLPLLYLALCAAVGFGIYLYAANFTPLFASVVGIVLYFGGIAAGCIALLFLVKPIFSSREFPEIYVELKRKDQPQLFALIDEVCARVKAPKPVKVRLENGFNASAGFERGWLGLLSNRLVLTIGAQLLQTLTVPQFGGVIAHELGHFTQAIGMRLNYVTFSINKWFGRIVYERDKWDAKLDHLARFRNKYVFIFTRTLKGLIWLSRQFLKLLRFFSILFSAHLLRQMEYQADFYEQQITGRANFRRTFIAMRIANLASTKTYQQLEGLRIEKQLVDDISQLFQHTLTTLPKASLRYAEESLDADRSVAKWFMTHPSDYQRLRRSAKRNEEGVLEGTDLAMSLMQNFDPLAKALTKIEYKVRVHAVSRENLIPTAKYLSVVTARNRRADEVRGFFGGMLSERNLFFAQDTMGIAALSREEVQARFDSCAAQLTAAADDTVDKREAIETLRLKRANAIAVKTQKENGITPSRDLGLPNKKITTINKAIANYSAEIKKLDAELEPLEQLAAEKLVCFCRLAELCGVEGNPAAARVAYLKRFLNSSTQIYHLMNAGRKSLFIAAVLANSYQASSRKGRVTAKLRDLGADFTDTMSEVGLIASKLDYPLRDKKRFASLNAFFLAKSGGAGALGQRVLMQNSLNRFDRLYMAVVTELLATGAGFVLPHETPP